MRRLLTKKREDQSVKEETQKKRGRTSKGEEILFGNEDPWETRGSRLREEKCSECHDTKDREKGGAAA